MPDTGAPWNIPYVENADLVSDWPADSLLVANAVAAGLSAAALPGIGSNVGQAVKTDAFSTASGTFVDVTGLSVTITPSSDTSKILVLYSVNIGTGATDDAFTVIQLVRDATVVNAGLDGTALFWGHNRSAITAAGNFVDSPATASAVTYKVQVKKVGTTTAYVNRNADPKILVSSLICIEVAA
jgi:hypothetical protein